MGGCRTIPFRALSRKAKLMPVGPAQSNAESATTKAHLQLQIGDATNDRLDSITTPDIVNGRFSTPLQGLQIFLKINDGIPLSHLTLHGVTKT